MSLSSTTYKDGGFQLPAIFYKSDIIYGIRFIGSAKQLTITIYQLEDGEYLPA